MSITHAAYTNITEIFGDRASFIKKNEVVYIKYNKTAFNFKKYGYKTVDIGTVSYVKMSVSGNGFQENEISKIDGIPNITLQILVDYINYSAENIGKSSLTHDSLKKFLLNPQLGMFYKYWDSSSKQNRIDATECAIQAGLFTVEMNGSNYNMLTPKGCNFILDNKDVQSFIEQSFGNVAINIIS